VDQQVALGSIHCSGTGNLGDGGLVLSIMGLLFAYSDRAACDLACKFRDPHVGVKAIHHGRYFQKQHLGCSAYVR
jgi:hypothetical protein